MTSTIVVIGGVTVSCPGSILPNHLTINFKGTDTFTYQVTGVGMPASDPYLGEAITVTVDGTLRFNGQVVSRNDSHTDYGYVSTYQCTGIRDRGDQFPVVDSNTGTNAAAFNLQPDDAVNYIASRAGRNVGQIITDVLTMTTNATNLDSVGIGNYTSLTPPTLPSTTVSDLAALTVQPPFPCIVQGEKLLTAIQGFLENVSPNTIFYVLPDGTMRFVDQRSFANHTFTLEVDPIEPIGWGRDTTECFSAVVVTGQPMVQPCWLSTSNGGLEEDFAHDGYTTNAAAKAAWRPTDFTQPQQAVDDGTCTCVDTLNVTVTSSHPDYYWSVNFWDQTTSGHLGVLYVYDTSLGSSLVQYTSRRIIANTALVAGGTSTLTLDYPLPITSYDQYQIRGSAIGANVVWRRYSIANTTIGSALATQFTYPVPWHTAQNNLDVLTSYPIASVCYGAAEVTVPFDQDAGTGKLMFKTPTSLVFGGGSVTTPPTDVRALLAVNQANLSARAPSSGYEGTYYTVDLASDAAKAKTLTVYVSDWRDPVNVTQMAVYAQNLLDSVKDTVIEGEIIYNGYYAAAMSIGTAASVTGNGYTTGFETCTSFTGGGCPVVAVELHWTSDGAGNVTVLHCSNRRAHFGVEQFQRPARQFVPIGTETGVLTPWGFSDSDHFTGFAGYMGSPTQDLSNDQGVLVGNDMEEFGGNDIQEEDN